MLLLIFSYSFTAVPGLKIEPKKISLERSYITTKQGPKNKRTHKFTPARLSVLRLFVPISRRTTAIHDSPTLTRRWARMRGRPGPWCYSRRNTGCWSGRRSPGRCRTNCCRRRCTWRRSRGRRRRLLVKVSRALPGVAAYGGVRRADERSRAVPRQCGSEIVIHSSVAGNERVGLAPVAARFGEQIGLALIGVASDRGGVRADESSAAVEGNRVAEVGARRTVASGQPL